jgi:hypothetical protein
MEYVYCIKNEAMPNICKCGGTAKNPEKRCKQLSNTSLPVECKIAYYVEVSSWKDAEKYIHDKLEKSGIKRYEKREWFDCKPDDIKYIFDECAKLFNKGKNDDLKCVINKKINIEGKTENKYFCKLCDYETNERGNFSRHKKQLKHINNLNSQNDIEKIKNENTELKNKINELEKKLLEKEIELLKLSYKKNK